MKYRLKQVQGFLADILKEGQIFEPTYEGSEYYKKEGSNGEPPLFNIMEIEDNPEYWEKITEENI